MKFRIIPSVDNKEELFKKAMAVLRRVAISFSILLSRWESVKVQRGMLSGNEYALTSR